MLGLELKGRVPEPSRCRSHVRLVAHAKLSRLVCSKEQWKGSEKPPALQGGEGLGCRTISLEMDGRLTTWTHRTWGRSLIRVLPLGEALAAQALMNRLHHPPPAGDASQVSRSIERLRGLMLESRKLEEIWRLFYEALAANQAFLEMGKRSKLPRLRAVVEAVVPRAANNPGRLVDLGLLAISSHGFWHGCALFEAAVCTVLYFEAENRGLLVISKGPFDPNVHFARFSFPEIPRGFFPVRGGAERV